MTAPGLRATVLREWQPFAAEPVPAAPGLDRLVPEVMKRLGLDQRLWESELCGNWAGIVGELNARLCQPSILRHGLLTITVSHPAYIQELRPLKALFLRKIQQRFGRTSVRDIIFRVG
jgi:predicted nucleic acid-binding Zn ribbon protein